MNPLFVPHLAYLQIGVLEIEKARRTTERNSATRRVAELDARLREIEAEEAALFQRLAERKRVDSSGAGMRLAPPRIVNALRIRY